MNIKLRLTEEGELEEKSSSGPTLEFVLENEEVLIHEEGEEELREQQQVCSQAAEDGRTEPCSADSTQSLNSKTDPDPHP